MKLSRITAGVAVMAYVPGGNGLSDTAAVSVPSEAACTDVRVCCTPGPLSKRSYVTPGLYCSPLMLKA